ncbi:MAG: hypothetical protein IKT40_06130 [Bacilli bacterium]|nr:hypothetical protein [Bacilli bacterium]
MPITQTSWLTNLTENDLTENLSNAISSISNSLEDNNNAINELLENQLTTVKNAIADISNDIAQLEASMPSSLIGAANDGYGTTTTGTVMGKLNYLIYLLAPTPATFNYSSAGTFSNITIPTGVKFISITACGGSGGGSYGTYYNPYQGKYYPGSNGLTGGKFYGMNIYCNAIANARIEGGVNVPLSNRTQYTYYNNYFSFYNNPGSYNYNAHGRRVSFKVAGYNNKWTNLASGCFGYYNYYYVNKNICKLCEIANNITTAGGNAGTVAAVSSKSFNVATSEVITVTVGAGGATQGSGGAAGGASIVTCSNGTATFPGGAGGAKGNSYTYSNWYTVANYVWNGLSGFGDNSTTVTIGGWRSTQDYGINIHWPECNFTTAVTAKRNGTITVTGSAGKTSAAANSLGKKAGNGGKGAEKKYILYTNDTWNNTSNVAGGAGTNGDSGYVRVAW